ncbi:hypothetical protein CC2G_013648 [Coprinopsis cinerea AmutBmut pab1-1]|nr:hypothetical protein CC2G_013648 [Coprinopsis cinerea AmutBmut pab1-1]
MPNPSVVAKAKCPPYNLEPRDRWNGTLATWHNIFRFSWCGPADEFHLSYSSLRPLNTTLQAIFEVPLLRRFPTQPRQNIVASQAAPDQTCGLRLVSVTLSAPQAMTPPHI